MIFKRLIFNNYKTYYGHQEIELYIPEDVRTDQKKNIILLGGLNGAGKTTFLKAVLYTLFGQRGISNDEFKKLRANIINDTFFDEGGREASITLLLEKDDGEEWTIKVKWYFNANKTMSHEERKISIKKPGSSVARYANVESIEAFNKLIDRIMPYYAASFFMFDGEEVKEIISRQNSNRLNEAIIKITGMKANMDLLLDLQTLKSKLENKLAKASSSKEIEKINQKIQALDSNTAILEKRAKKYKESILELEKKLEHLKKDRYNKMLQNSNSRESIIKTHTTLTTSIKLANAELEQYLLENTTQMILGNKIEKLKSRLKDEKKAHEKQLLKDASLAPYRNFINNLLSQKINPALSEVQLEQIRKIGEQVWIQEYEIESSPSKGTKQIHDLTSNNQAFLLNLRIKDRNHVSKLIDHVEKLKGKLEEVEIDLENAPNAVDVSSENEQIESLTIELGELQLLNKSNNSKLRKHIEERTSLSSQFSKLSSTDSNAENLYQQLDFVTRTIAALSKYVSEMRIIKTTLIKDEFDKMLRLLFRKKDEFGKIEFDIDSSTIRLYNDKMQEISINDRSAGEMQMITSALIWALTKASDLKLPIVIDTPLGRLDSIHRKHLINYYYKELSEQVIILSTDSEITSEYVNMMKDNSYKQYMLDYNEEKKYTIIRDGYFERLRG
ncbi:DNA sulfur modification protein DndD [Viridibacillus arvi]|uniref:DNA sulfur modification protein DndD n=1 Tax=Viridibacillus arvi TaxID=263475 RepID=UPI0034CDABB1